MTELRNTEQELSRFRLRVLAAALFVVFAFGLLVARLSWLQVARHEELATQAENNRIAVVPITPNRGLVRADVPIGIPDLRAFAEVDIDEDDPRYRKPLERDVRKLARKLSADAEVVLLGSIATGKYVDVLLENFGERLVFSADFVGRGDMSRGGLLLRCAVDRCELRYIPVSGAIRKGKRPPKLEPRRYTK